MSSVIDLTAMHRKSSGTVITLDPTKSFDGTHVVVTECSTVTKIIDDDPTKTKEHHDISTRTKEHRDRPTVTKVVTAMTVVVMNDVNQLEHLHTARNQSPATLPSLSSASGPFVREVDLDSTTFTMSKPTQTVGNRVFVQDPLNKYRAYDPYNHAVAPTGSCDSGSITGNDCRHEKCMWNFMKPMNISTVMPAVFYNAQRSFSHIDYVTHVTELRQPHWGVSTTGGLYYPTHREIVMASGTTTTAVHRATPAGHLPNADSVHGMPVCYDMETCHNYCSKHSKTFPWMSGDHLKMLLFPLMALILLFALILLCCGCTRRRNKNKDPNDPNRRDSVVDKLRRKSSTKPEVVVINQVSGTAQDPSTGQTADPSQANAVVTGAAAGAEAGREKQAEDGKGTMGRRAEEGRGRVEFEDGTRPGNEGPPPSSAPPQQTTEVVHQDPPPAQTERVESKPAPAPGQADGTSELSTGYHAFDIGSMRGRKRARPEAEGNRLNLAFWGR